MISDSNLASPRSAGPALHAAFRRGRTLVWMVVGVTALLILQDAVRRVWPGQWHGQASGAVFGCLLGGWICWHALRGGTISTGCLTLFYGVTALISCFLLSMFVPMLGVALGTLLVELVRPTGHLPAPAAAVPAHVAGGSNGLWFLGNAAWSAFAVWVLVFSADARVYRDARRRHLFEGNLGTPE